MRWKGDGDVVGSGSGGLCGIVSSTRGAYWKGDGDVVGGGFGGLLGRVTEIEDVEQKLRAWYYDKQKACCWHD